MAGNQGKGEGVARKCFWYRGRGSPRLVCFCHLCPSWPPAALRIPRAKFLGLWGNIAWKLPFVHRGLVKIFFECVCFVPATADIRSSFPFVSAVSATHGVGAELRVKHDVSGEQSHIYGLMVRQNSRFFCDLL